MKTKVPGINRAKLISLGKEKIKHACDVHAKQMRRFQPGDCKYRIAKGLLAQCVLAFNEVSRKPKE